MGTVVEVLGELVGELGRREGAFGFGEAPGSRPAVEHQVTAVDCVDDGEEHVQIGCLWDYISIYIYMGCLDCIWNI
jgi:hypothetical protein